MLGFAFIYGIFMKKGFWHERGHNSQGGVTLVRKLFLLAACYSMFSLSYAAVQENSPSTPDTTQVSQPQNPDDVVLHRGVVRNYMKKMSLIAGAGILKSEPAFALALRGDLPKKFLWEVGGLFPRPVSGYADQSVSGTNGSGPFTISSHVDAFGDMPMALLYPLYQQERLILDGGAGFSLGFITNRADEQSTVFGTPSSSTAKGQEVSPSPFRSLGAA